MLLKKGYKKVRKSVAYIMSIILLCLCLCSCYIHVCEDNLSDWLISKVTTIYEDGKEQRFCSICHKIIKERPVAKLEHNCEDYATDWETEIEPTVNTIGLKYGVC